MLFKNSSSAMDFFFQVTNFGYFHWNDDGNLQKLVIGDGWKLNFSTTWTYCLIYACLVIQLCPTLCDLLYGSPPGSCVHGIFFRQESWSGLPFPSPGDLPDPGIEPGSPALQADCLPAEPLGKPKFCFVLFCFLI